MEFQYFLMRGRRGASGYGMKRDGKKEVVFRGLKPGQTCALYALNGSGARFCGTKEADGAGQASFTVPDEGPLFAAADGQAILWEGENENFLRACAWLEKEKKKREVTAEKPAAEEKNEKAAAGEARGEEKEDAPARAKTEAAVFSEDKVSGSDQEKTAAEKNTPEERWTLRPAGEGEAVDALTELKWPEGALEFKPYFDSLPPCAPFDAPGWRFVRAPFAGDLPFCAVGYLSRDGRVREIACAYPAGRLRPPYLIGGRFQPGRDGYDYWVTAQKV